MKRKNIEIIEGMVKNTGYFEKFIKIDDEPIDAIFENYKGDYIKLIIETEISEDD